MSDTPTHQRRVRLMAALPESAVAVIPALSPVIRSKDVDHPFGAYTDFYYLVGAHIPGAVLIMDTVQQQVSLYVDPFNEKLAQWSDITWHLGNVKTLGIENACPLDEFFTDLTALLTRSPRVLYSPIGAWPRLDVWLLEHFPHWRDRSRRSQFSPSGWSDISPLIARERLIKDSSEIQHLKQAATWTVLAHQAWRQQVDVGVNESLGEAHFVHQSYLQGQGGYLPYPPIVAGGSHACCLHYQRNDTDLRDGELLLTDAGLSCEGYAADVTRTYPVNGQWLPEQKAIFDIVESAFQAGAKELYPGSHWIKVEMAVQKALLEGLVAEGILCGDIDTLQESKAYQPYYMHGAGHWLGLDVHDVGAYYENIERPTLFQEGMVVTLEPGLYFAMPGSPYSGIGVRTEDDLLITANGHENLTAALPHDLST